MEEGIGRRAALHSIGTSALLALATTPSLAASRNDAASPAPALRQSTHAAAWSIALATYERAFQALKADEEVYDRTYSKWMATRPSPDLIDWDECHVLNGFGADRNWVAHKMDVEEHWANFLALERQAWWSPDPEQTKRRRRQALDSILAFRRRCDEHLRQSGLDEAVNRSDRLFRAEREAWAALIEMPAPDLRALLWKLEQLLGPDALDAEGHTPAWSEDIVSTVMADARRLIALAVD